MSPTTDQAGQAWTADAVPRSVGVLRDHARRFAESHGAGEDVAHRVALGVSEAAANAVLHAYPGEATPGPVELRCRAGSGELQVTVSDRGRGLQARGDSPGMGLGLSTMGRLAERLDVRPGPGGLGTTVALTFWAPGVHGGAPLPRDDPRAQLLAAASELARSAAWPREGFERLCDLVVGAVGDVACVDVVEHGTLRRLAALVDGDAALSAWLARSTPPVKPGTATWDALQRGEGRLVVHDPSAPRSPGGPGEVLGLGWWLAVPLADGENVRAVLGVGGRGDRPPPDGMAIDLVRDAARRAAGGLADAVVLTAMQTTRRRLEAVLSALDDAVTVVDGDGRIAYANAVAARLLGAASVPELLSADAAAWFARFAFTGEDGERLPLERFPAGSLPGAAGSAPLVARAVERVSGRVRWLRLRSRVLDDEEGPLVATVVRDVTAVVVAEHRRRATQIVGELLDRPADGGAAGVLQAVAEALVPSLADGCAIALLHAGGRLRPAALAHPDPEQLARLRALRGRWPASADGPGREVLTTGRVASVAITDAFLRARAEDEAHLELLLAVGLRALLVVPLRAGGRPTGLLTLAHDRSSARTFDEDDVAFAVDLGRRVGAAAGA